MKRQLNLNKIIAYIITFFILLSVISLNAYAATPGAIPSGATVVPSTINTGSALQTFISGGGIFDLSNVLMIQGGFEVSATGVELYGLGKCTINVGDTRTGINITGSNVVLDGFTIVQQNTNPAVPCSNIYVSGGDNAIISNNVIEVGPSQGNGSDGGGYGIITTSPAISTITLKGNDFISKASNKGYSAFFIDKNCTNALIENNTFDGEFTRYASTFASTSKVYNNTFMLGYNTSGYIFPSLDKVSLYISGSGVTTRNVDIVGNQFLSPKQNVCIVLENATGNINGNTFNSNNVVASTISPECLITGIVQYPMTGLASIPDWNSNINQECKDITSGGIEYYFYSPLRQLTVTKTITPSSAKPGDIVDCTITVTNTGLADLTSITLDDPQLLSNTFPAFNLKAQYIDASGKVIPGEIKVLTGKMKIPENATGSVVNTAEAKTIPTEPLTPSTQYLAIGKATVNVIPTSTPPISTTNLSITKTASPIDPSPGQVVTYTFKVTNIGNTTLNNVSIDDSKLDAGTLSPSSISSLSPGQTATFTGKMTVPNTSAGYTISNTAYATVNGTRMGNAASVNVTVRTNPVFIPIPPPINTSTVAPTGDPFVYVYDNQTQAPPAQTTSEASKTHKVKSEKDDCDTDLKSDKKTKDDYDKKLKSNKKSDIKSKSDCDKKLQDAVINAKSYTVQVGEEIDIMKNVTAIDDGGRGKDITNDVTITGYIYTNKPGNYGIVYKVTGGNCRTVSKTITITVAKP